MIVRLLLIISLTAQLALSYRCCGMTILCVCLASPENCLAVGCDKAAPEECCASDACCDAGEAEIVADSCCSAPSVSPCESDDRPCDPSQRGCTPIVPPDKAPTPIDHGKSLDLFSGVGYLAHPVLDAPIIMVPSVQQWNRHLPSRFKSNHHRQATLEVWQN